jgi:tRNA(adenine34) deaminase
VCSDGNFGTLSIGPLPLIDEAFMREALALAATAKAAGESPIGAVLVRDGRVIGRGANSPILLKDPTAHAEVLAIRQAALESGNYRLGGTCLYVTLEPCVMCAGAIVHARVDRLVFGARDLRFGGVRSKFRLADSDLLNHRVEIVEGVCAAESVALLQDFFAERR